jgi:methylitaconate Delta-isomerase
MTQGAEELEIAGGRRGDQVRIPCAIVRSGTSKGIFMRATDLPVDEVQLEATIMRIFGSPDPRQIDGLGGADLLTSKVAIIGPSARDDADVDYLFGQVNVDKPGVDWSGNCGNISSGVGPYAIDEGMVEAVAPVTTVRIYNVNTDRILIAHVPVTDAVAATAGDAVINGVPGTGAPIQLDFHKCVGGTTGRLLPLGAARVPVDIDGVSVDATLVDAGNLTGFVRASDLDLPPDLTWEQMADRELLGRLDRVRAALAYAAGLTESVEVYLERPRLLPQLALVGAPRDFTSQSDQRPFAADDVDFLSRLFVIGTFHRAYPITGLTAASIAARLEGSVVWSCIPPAARTAPTVRVGHPCGVAYARVRLAGTEVEEITIERTARRLMDGFAYLPEAFAG